MLEAVRTGRLDAAALARATAARTIAAWTLAPAPADPVVHIAAAHAQARLHLLRVRDLAAERTDTVSRDGA